MLTSHFKRWFFRPAESDTPGEDLPVAPVHSSRRARHRATVVPGLEVAVSQTATEILIRVKGDATTERAGALLDGLLAPAACRPAVVTLDLSELRSISSLAMGVLVAYRRAVVRTGGRVRLAETLQPAVCAALARAELFSQFETITDSGSAPNCT
jgi:anti-anti-sigma factor